MPYRDDIDMTNEDSIKLTNSAEGTTDPTSVADAAERAERRHSHGHHSHHSSHSRHSSHSHSRSGSSSKKRSKKKNSKMKEKFVSFVKNNKKYLIYAAITLVFLALLIVVGLWLDGRFDADSDKPGGNDSGVVSTASGELMVSIPLFNDEVVTYGPAVAEFLKTDVSVSVNEFNKEYKTDARRDVGLPVKLEYDIAGMPSGERVQSAEFVVADNADFKNPYVFAAKGNNAFVDIYNLMTGAEYFYRINITFTSGAKTTVSGTFETAAGPRILMVDGVRNIRDIGGWKTADGGMIKQGLLFRGPEIDGAVEPEYRITSDGVNTMLTTLGVKTDMDLRGESENPYGIDALGPGVNHIYYGAPMYSSIFNSAENGEIIRKIFSDLADYDNYPVYLHCTYGADRTGTVCYLLEALLGMDAESLTKEYELTGLRYGEISIPAFRDFVDSVRALPGYSLSAKVEGYLLSVGVTAEEIASIREIFIEY